MIVYSWVNIQTLARVPRQIRVECTYLQAILSSEAKCAGVENNDRLRVMGIIKAEHQLIKESCFIPMGLQANKRELERDQFLCNID